MWCKKVRNFISAWRHINTSILHIADIIQLKLYCLPLHSTSAFIAAGSYYHEYFLKGKPSLTCHIYRTRIKGTGVRQAIDRDLEPNFYTMDPVGEGSYIPKDEATLNYIKHNDDLIGEIRYNGKKSRRGGGTNSRPKKGGKSCASKEKDNKVPATSKGKKKDHAILSSNFEGNELPAIASGLSDHMDSGRSTVIPTSILPAHKVSDDEYATITYVDFSSTKKGMDGSDIDAYASKKLDFPTTIEHIVYHKRPAFYDRDVTSVPSAYDSSLYQANLNAVPLHVAPAAPVGVVAAPTFLERNASALLSIFSPRETTPSKSSSGTAASSDCIEAEPSTAEGEDGQDARKTAAIDAVMSGVEPIDFLSSTEQCSDISACFHPPSAGTLAKQKPCRCGHCENSSTDATKYKRLDSINTEEQIEKEEMEKFFKTIESGEAVNIKDDIELGNFLEKVVADT